jgi:hypothetical protein
MNNLNHIIKLIESNLIYCLAPIVISLAIAKKLFKNKLPNKEALMVIKWTIILFTVIIDIKFLIDLYYTDEFNQFIDRANGTYRLAYILMLFCSTILPFSLLIKNLGTKYWYLLIISIFMKIGFYFERFVIIITSIHRDSLTNIWDSKTYNFWFDISLILSTQGIIISILLLLIIKLLQKKKQFI